MEKEKYVSSLAENPIKSKSSKKNRLIGIVVLIGLVLAVSFSYKKMISLYNHYFVNNHQEVNAYLEKVQLFNDSSDMIVNNIRLKLYNTDENEYIRLIQDGEDAIRDELQEMNAVKPPGVFSAHRNAFLAVLNQKITILENYKNTKKNYQFEELNKSIDVLGQRQDLERKALIHSFKKEGIEYKQLGDGSIRYWYKNHSAQSIGTGGS